LSPPSATEPRAETTRVRVPTTIIAKGKRAMNAIGKYTVPAAPRTVAGACWAVGVCWAAGGRFPAGVCWAVIAAPDGGVPPWTIPWGPEVDALLEPGVPGWNGHQHSTVGGRIRPGPQGPWCEDSPSRPEGPTDPRAVS